MSTGILRVPGREVGRILIDTEDVNLVIEGYDKDAQVKYTHIFFRTGQNIQIEDVEHVILDQIEALKLGYPLPEDDDGPARRISNT